MHRAQNPETPPKVSKRVSLGPPKSSEKGPKSPNTVDFNYFLGLFGFFSELCGGPTGPKLLSGDFF